MSYPPYRITADSPVGLALARLAFRLNEYLSGGSSEPQSSAAGLGDVRERQPGPSGVRAGAGRVRELARRLAIASFGAGDAELALADGTRFRFPLNDPYWCRLVNPRYRYEPEIAWLLGWIRELDYTFIDAGANFGFWSVMVSSEAFGSKPAIAV